MNGQHFIKLACRVGLLSTLAGCGSGLDRASVHGMVTLDGKPVQAGSITFVPTEGTTGPSAGAAIQAGHYTIDAAKGVVVGKNRIELRANKKTGRQIPDWTIRGNMMDEIIEAFPPEYNTQSQLVETVQSGKNQIDLEIVSSKKSTQ